MSVNSWTAFVLAKSLLVSTIRLNIQTTGDANVGALIEHGMPVSILFVLAEEILILLLQESFELGVVLPLVHPHTISKLAFCVMSGM